MVGMVSSEPTAAEFWFDGQRARLQSIAYGMLGSVMEAEDIVQDVYLRWSQAAVAEIENPAGWLTTVTTRLAIDRLRSAQRRRESYIGPWLPEPIIADFAPDPADVVVEAETLSTALLTAMERLTPNERAVLLLREFFDLDYAAIADIVDLTPAHCRQLAARARQHVADPLRRTRHDTATEARLATAYVEALQRGDVAGLARIFAEDVVLWADGGGEVRAARHPIVGAERVARHLVGVRSQTPPDLSVDLVRANGDVALLGRASGVVVGIIGLDVRDGTVIGVRAFLNPAKLGHL